MIQQFAPEYSDYSFHEWILLRLSVARPNGLDAYGTEELLNFRTAKNWIIIVNQILRLLSKWCGFSELLDCPGARGVFGDGYVLDHSAFVTDDNQHVEHAKCDGLAQCRSPSPRCSSYGLKGMSSRTGVLFRSAANQRCSAMSVILKQLLDLNHEGWRNASGRLSPIPISNERGAFLVD